MHLKFTLLPETLFLTVNLMDRFLSHNKINKNEYHLLGISALLIACKYEEIYAPEIRDFVHICDKVFSKQQIIKMELNILTSLNFDILTVSPFRFLERFYIACETDQKSFFLSQYFLELALVDNRLNYPSSMKAISALIISRKILKIIPDFPKILQKVSGYPYEMLRNTIKDLCCIISAANNSQMNAVKIKFSNINFMEVALIQTLEQ